MITSYKMLIFNDVIIYFLHQKLTFYYYFSHIAKKYVQLTLKITRIRHEPEKRFGKKININQKLKEFYNEIKKHKLEDIIYIDEISISVVFKKDINVIVN